MPPAFQKVVLMAFLTITVIIKAHKYVQNTEQKKINDVCNTSKACLQVQYNHP